MWRNREDLQARLDELFVMERIWLEERLELNQTNLSRKLSQKMALFRDEWRMEMKRREQEDNRVPNGNVDDLKVILHEVKKIEERMMKKEETLELKLLEVGETVKQQNEKYKLLQEEFSKIKSEREEISGKQSEIDKEKETLREQQERLAAEERNQLMKAMQQKDELARQWEQIALEKQKLEEIKCKREKELERQKEMEMKIQRAVKNEELAKQRATALEIEKNMEIERVKIEMEREAIKKDMEREQEMQALRKNLAEQEIKEQKKKFTREEKDQKRQMEDERRTLEEEKIIIGEEWNFIERQKVKLQEKQKNIARERKAIGEEWSTIELAKSKVNEKQTAGENKKIKAAWSSIEKEKKKLVEEQNTFEIEWHAIEKERKKLQKQQKDVAKMTEISENIEFQTTERNPKKVPKKNSAKEKTKPDKHRGQDLRKVKMTEDDKMTSQKTMETEMACAPALEYQRRGNENSMAEQKKKLVEERHNTKKDLIKTEKETAPLPKSILCKPRAEPGPGPSTQKRADTDQRRPKEAQVVAQNIVLKPKRTKAVDPLDEFDKELDALLHSEIDTDDEKDLFKAKKEMAPKPSTSLLLKPKGTRAVEPLDDYLTELEALLNSEDNKKDLGKAKNETERLPACCPLPTGKPPQPSSSLRTALKTEPGPGRSSQNKADVRSKGPKVGFTTKTTKELDRLDELSKEIDELLDSTGF